MLRDSYAAPKGLKGKEPDSSGGKGPDCNAVMGVLQEGMGWCWHAIGARKRWDIRISWADLSARTRESELKRRKDSALLRGRAKESLLQDIQ